MSNRVRILLATLVAAAGALAAAVRAAVAPRTAPMLQGKASASSPMFKAARLLVLSSVCCLLAASGAAAAGSPLPGGWANPHRHSLGVPSPTTRFDWFGPFSSPFGSLGSALVGSTPTAPDPSALAFNAATHTIYVANGYNDNGPSAGGNTVSVIDTRRCQAQDISRCRGPWPTITVGNLPSSVAVDEVTDTVYVTNVGDNTVSVFNGATCNATNTSGCGQTPATVPVGEYPIGLYADPANHTVYVPNSDNGAGDSTTLSMINSATCDAADLTGCPTTEPPTVDVGSAPFDVVVDQSTHTVYVGTVTATAVFDANTCNAVQSGCGAIGMLPGGPAGGPNGFGVDDANHTLYTADYGNTISAFDTQQCDASDLAGCATDAPGTVMPFPPQLNNEAALYVAVDVPLHSVYVTFQRDDALMVVDTNVCNGSNPAGCATLNPPVARTGAQPEGVVLDPQTQTLYTANVTDNDVSVIDATRCNAQVTAGCRQAPPAAPISAWGLVADPAVNTLYATAPNANAVSMVNTRTCNSYTSTGCAGTPAQVTVGATPVVAAVNPLTHTVYVANQGAATTGTVSVIDADTCNATDSAGCASIQTLQVPGGNPDDIKVDATTDTVYVTTLGHLAKADAVAVYNGATCNATKTTGCSQTPAMLMLGNLGGFLSQLAVNQATNTIYATNVAFGGPGFVDNSVYVFNGATCDAANTTGCGQAPAVITPGNPLTPPGGLAPWGIAVDEVTDTIYVALQADGDFAGRVAVIDGATCNGSNTTGCGQTPATAAAGFGASEVGLDPTTHTVYATNTEDASLSVIPGAICNRFISFGCGLVLPKLATGTYPGFSPGTIAVDAADRTAYVANEAGGISVIPLAP
jgi:DNA-binding beta-propeller fold protein YncE